MGTSFTHYSCIIGFTHNDMKANPFKLHFMVTGSSEIQLKLTAATLEQEDYVKLPGVNIDKNLDFKFHVNGNRTDLTRLEHVQEKALRLVYNDKDCSYYEQLSWANVPSVLIKWQ